MEYNGSHGMKNEADMRGADRLVQILARHGVTTLFSLSGNQIMPIYDACFDAKIRIIHTRHECAAVFMADAWAQLKDTVGVALVTAGPGFGNALGALYTARASESPVLLLSGDSAIAQDRRGAFQELDQVAASRPFTKLSFRSHSAEAIGADVARAIDVACSGRPGPVHLALPFDVVQALSPGGSVDEDVAARAPEPARNDVVAVRKAIGEAVRPVVLLGPQNNTTRAAGLAARLRQAVNAPTIVMESPRGLNDPALGALTQLLAEADLIVALGKRIDFTLGFGAKAKFAANSRWIAIDADEVELQRASLSLGSRLLHGINAAARPFSEMLAAEVLDETSPRRDWLHRCDELLSRRDYSAAKRASSNAITALTISQAVAEAMASLHSPLVIVDGGEFGQWAQAVLPSDNRLINGPAGAIGSSLAYAIGAKAARPQSTVFALMGDGTAGFHLLEFETAARETLPFIAIIGNDRRWNAEHQIQLRDYGGDRLIGCQLSGARYDLAAAALGGYAAHVTHVDELAPAIAQAIASNRPACINVEMEGLAAPVIASHG